MAISSVRRAVKAISALVPMLFAGCGSSKPSNSTAPQHEVVPADPDSELIARAKRIVNQRIRPELADAEIGRPPFLSTWHGNKVALKLAEITSEEDGEILDLDDTAAEVAVWLRPSDESKERCVVLVWKMGAVTLHLARIVSLP